MNSVPRSGLASNFLAILATHMVGRSIRFLYLIAIARLLPPEDVGIYTYGVALYLTFLGLSLFGQQGILSTRIGRSRGGLLTLVAHSLTVRLIATGTVAAALLFFALLTEPESGNLPAIIFFVLTLIPRSLAMWVRNCYLALEQTAWIPRWEIGFRTSEAVTGVAVLLAGGGLAAICFLHLFFWSAEAIASLYRLTHHAHIPLRLGLKARYLLRLARQSVFFLFSLWLVDAFLIFGVVIVRGLQDDTAAVGFFGIAMQLFTTFMVIFVALGDTLLPKLARAYNRENATPGLEAMPMLMRMVLVAGAPMAILASAYLPPLITKLLGAQYALVGPIFAQLAWSVGPYAFVLLAMQSLNSAGYWRAAVIVVAVPAALQIGLMVTWAGDGDLFRAAWSLVIASFAGAIVAAAALKIRLGQVGIGRNLFAIALLIAASQLFRLDLPALALGGMNWATGLLLAALYIVAALAARLFTIDDIKTLFALGRPAKAS